MSKEKGKMAAEGKPATKANAGNSTSSEIQDSIQRITDAQAAFASGAANAMGKGIVGVIEGSNNAMVEGATAMAGVIAASSTAIDDGAKAMQNVITASGDAVGNGIKAMGKGVADVTKAWFDALNGFTKALEEAGQKLGGGKASAQPSRETLNAGLTREPH